jgi:hypothetical protein
LYEDLPLLLFLAMTAHGNYFLRSQQRKSDGHRWLFVSNYTIGRYGLLAATRETGGGNLGGRSILY